MSYSQPYLPYLSVIIDITRFTLLSISHVGILGLAQWHQVRANWTAKSKYPSTQLKEPSTPPPEEDFNMIDVEQVLVCLHRQERFPTNVPLASLVELLNVLWEEDGAM